VLQIGDSLIQKIAGEIADGDFLIAIISPDSVESGWCQRELSLAATQGINEKRAKVLPVRFRGAQIPAMLGDIFYGDADRFSMQTIAEKVAAAIRAHLEGRGEDAVQAAEAVEPAGGEPPHAEAAGNATVTQIEEVAQRAWDRGRLGRWQHPRSERPAAAVALGARPPVESSPRCAPAGRADGERRQRLVLRRR